jgi:hypothetical protein
MAVGFDGKVLIYAMLTDIWWGQVRGEGVTSFFIWQAAASCSLSIILYHCKVVTCFYFRVISFVTRIYHTI